MMPDLQTITFAEPMWWWLLPAITVLLAMVTRSRLLRLTGPSAYPQNPSRHIFRHALFMILRDINIQATRSTQKYQNLKLFSIYFIFVFFIVMSLAQPYRQGTILPTPPNYRDIVFIVNTSVSMVLRDYELNKKRVDRISMVKGVLNHFIQQLQGNRIGIVAFSERAYTVVPLTTDYPLLQQQLARLVPASLTGRTTDLSHGLLYALKTIQQQSIQQIPDQTETSTSANTVMVLLTDANRPRRNIDPRVVAAYIKEQGLRLHTIAIGAPSIKAQAEKTTLIYEPTNFKLLEQIATAASGQFYWAKNTASLRAAINAIQQTEKHQVRTEPHYIKIPLFHWPLLFALLWITAWQLLPRFKKIRLKKSGDSYE